MRTDSLIALKTAEYEINEINMILKTVVPENDDHLIISGYEPLKIKVFPLNLMSFRIPCHEKPSPCKIKLKYLNQMKGITPDLIIFQSCTQENPKENKCDKKFIAP